MDTAKRLFKDKDSITFEMLNEFVLELKRWKEAHITNEYSSDHLIGQIYKENIFFKKKEEYRQLCKCHVSLALKCLEKLIAYIQANNIEPVQYGKHVFEYLFDLKEYIEEIDPKSDPNYSFVDGWKSYSDMSVIMFREARNLFWAGCLEVKEPIPYRTAMPLAVFGLRQAIEVRLRRAIGIFKIVDEKMNDAKLRHDFIFDFFNANLDLVEMKVASIQNLAKIYKWTNYNIHNGGIPRIWEVEYAFEYASKLFESDKMEHGKTWSIHSSIKINDYAELKCRFEALVNKTLPNSKWDYIYLDSPEAVIN